MPSRRTRSGKLGDRLGAGEAVLRPHPFIGDIERGPRDPAHRERLNEILVHHTGQNVKRIQDDTERDYIMSADQGKEYGIIDDVIRKNALKPPKGLGRRA